MRMVRLLITAILLLAAGQAAAQERVWTSSDGQTIRGEFIREVDGDVTLLVAGKIVTMPLDRLSERDQQIVRDLAAGKPLPADSPPGSNKRVVDDPVESSPAPAEQETPAPPPALGPRKAKAPTNRVWTDTAGRKTTGKFVRVFGDKVVISRSGGPITIGFYELSEADQTYVRELLASRGEENIIPEPPSATAPVDAENRPPGAGPVPGNRAGGGMRPGGFGPMDGPNGTGRGRPPPGLAPGTPQPIQPRTSETGSRPPPGLGAPGPPESTFPGPAAPASPPVEPAVPPHVASPPDYPSSAEQGQPSAPTVHSPPDPMYQPPDPGAGAFQRVPICSNCQRQVSESEAKGKRCPHCGALWVFDQYHTGSGSSSGSAAGSGSSTSQSPLSGAATERTVRAVILIVAAVVGVVVVCGGAIAVAVAIASASSAGNQYRQLR